jgi:transposase
LPIATGWRRPCSQKLVRALGLLDAARRQEVRDRTRAIQRLRAVWTTIDPAAEASTARLKSPQQVRRLRRITFAGGLVERTAQRCVRELAARIADHNHRIAALEHDIAQVLATHGNPVDDVIGGGPIVAAQLIAHAGDARRFRNAAAFAAYRGTSPIACGSGKTSGRHRLNPAGNRQLNTSIHRIALTQARLDPRARAYLARKKAEGKTDREARRALKRHLTNVVYRHLTTWANQTPLT